MTVESATNRLFHNGLMLVSGFVSPGNYKEAALRIHWGSFGAGDEISRYYVANYVADGYSHSPLTYDMPRFSRTVTVEGSQQECLEAWETWRDCWADARPEEDVRVRLGVSDRYVRETSYRLMFHLSQALMMARAEIMTPSNQRLVKGLDRLIYQLVQKQEAVVPA